MILKTYIRNTNQYEAIHLHIVNGRVYRAENNVDFQYREACEFHGMTPEKAHAILTEIADPNYRLAATSDYGN